MKMNREKTVSVAIEYFFAVGLLLTRDAYR